MTRGPGRSSSKLKGEECVAGGSRASSVLQRSPQASKEGGCVAGESKASSVPQLSSSGLECQGAHRGGI